MLIKDPQKNTPVFSLTICDEKWKPLARYFSDTPFRQKEVQDLMKQHGQSEKSQHYGTSHTIEADEGPYIVDFMNEKEKTFKTINYAEIQKKEQLIKDCKECHATFFSPRNFNIAPALLVVNPQQPPSQHHRSTEGVAGSSSVSTQEEIAKAFRERVGDGSLGTIVRLATQLRESAEQTPDFTSPSSP